MNNRCGFCLDKGTYPRTALCGRGTDDKPLPLGCPVLWQMQFLHLKVTPSRTTHLGSIPHTVIGRFVIGLLEVAHTRTTRMAGVPIYIWHWHLNEKIYLTYTKDTSDLKDRHETALNNLMILSIWLNMLKMFLVVSTNLEQRNPQWKPPNPPMVDLAIGADLIWFDYRVHQKFDKWMDHGAPWGPASIVAAVGWGGVSSKIFSSHGKGVQVAHPF